MTHEKVRRGDLYGPIFDVEHLATFTVGSKQGTFNFLKITFSKFQFFNFLNRLIESRRWHA